MAWNCLYTFKESMEGFEFRERMSHKLSGDENLVQNNEFGNGCG